LFSVHCFIILISTTAKLQKKSQLAIHNSQLFCTFAAVTCVNNEKE